MCKFFLKGINILSPFMTLVTKNNKLSYTLKIYISYFYACGNIIKEHKKYINDNKYIRSNKIWFTVFIMCKSWKAYKVLRTFRNSCFFLS